MMPEVPAKMSQPVLNVCTSAMPSTVPEMVSGSTTRRRDHPGARLRLSNPAGLAAASGLGITCQREIRVKLAGSPGNYSPHSYIFHSTESRLFLNRVIHHVTRRHLMVDTDRCSARPPEVYERRGWLGMGQVALCALADWVFLRLSSQEPCGLAAHGIS